MTTFLEDESGVELSQPREGIEIITPAATWRIATGTRDVTIGGNLYTASPSGRGEVAVFSLDEGSGDLIVQLPIAHPACQRYLAGGVPPREILVNVYRHQTVSNSTETLWRGVVSSMAVEAHVGKFRVLSQISVLMGRRLPTISASRSCPHILYDSNCRVNRTSFTIAATVAALDGRKVTIDVAMDAQWAQGGELLHVDSGEWMPIFDQLSTLDLAGSHAIITMQAPIYGMQVGSAIQVSAGCSHALVTCGNKFANHQNFGGQPYLPMKNMFIPGGFGIVEE